MLGVISKQRLQDQVTLHYPIYLDSVHIALCSFASHLEEEKNNRSARQPESEEDYQRATIARIQ